MDQHQMLIHFNRQELPSINSDVGTETENSRGTLLFCKTRHFSPQKKAVHLAKVSCLAQLYILLKLK